jgi:hypothetical protein
MSIPIHPPISLRARLDADLMGKEQGQEERNYLGLSSVGNCLRQQGYRLMPETYAADPFSLSSLQTFHEGNITESDIIGRLVANGVKITSQQDGVNFFPSDAPGVHLGPKCTVCGDEIPTESLAHGHIDGVIHDVPTIDGPVCAVIDIKAISFAGKKIREAGGDIGAAWPQYYSQIQAYMHCIGLKMGVILLKERPGGDMYEHWISYDRGHCLELEDRLLTVRRMLDGQLPPREYDPHGKDWQCRYCSFSKQCKEDD